jgi:hypothetical protein
MNSTEKKMLELLNNLKSYSGAVAVKAEFEAEGTRVEELLRLLDISRRANFRIGLKIGGCEAVRDLIEAKQFGVDYIIAPMVETAYAASKFIEAKNKIFSFEERKDVDFLINIETKTGFSNVDNIVKQISTSDGLQGIVFGRVDYVGSHGVDLDSVDEDWVTSDCKNVASICKKYNLDFVIGGGVSNRAISPLKDVSKIHLSRFETRKIIFESSSLDGENLKDALLWAVHFELLWLINKREYYSVITNEDNKRIEMLNNRWKLLSND